MTMKNTFLVVDTETGGLSCKKNSILSIAGVIWQPRGEISKLFDFYIKEPVMTVKKMTVVSPIQDKMKQKSYQT